MENWQTVIDHFGSVQALTNALELKSTMAIYQWKKRGIPAIRAMQIEHMTNGKFKGADLVKIKFDS